MGHYDLADDEVMIVDVPAAAKEVAPYQGIQLGSMWYISLDYVNHQTSLTADQARIDPDGRMRFVISERDPGVANWLERTGHGRGYVQLRWQRLTRDLGPEDGPEARRRPVQRPRQAPAVLRQRAGDPAGMAGAHRRAPGRGREKDDRIMMLQDKVVVVAGIGPASAAPSRWPARGKGRTWCSPRAPPPGSTTWPRRSPRWDGARCAVPADVTDAEAAERLAEAAHGEFGRVDALVYNALAMPPIKPLGAVPLEALQTAFDANVVAALRLTRLLIPALAESKGSVVIINSMVVRFSEPTMGPYKLAKAAMLAMAQSLATELGPQGIRVNSVAPGHIWGDSLKWYFGYLAKKRGVSAEEIYAETAASIDLRRLPEPDEIADAAVFLASPLARAITGQCLDVNCGEYHH